LHAMGWNLGSMGDFDHGIADIHEAAAAMDQLAHDDPQNRVYPQARAAISRSLGVIEDYAGHTAEALADYKIAISIYQQLIAANPNNPYARTSVADLEASSAMLSVKLGHHAEAVQLAHAGLPVLKETAMKKDASAAELNLAARFVTEKELPEFCDAKLGLDLAKRANEAAAGKDYVVLETLAQAYWMNRDRDNAAHSIEQALSLIETPAAGKEPNRSRRVYEKELADYRTGKLPAGCPAAPAKR
jgi:tetratricopeptide (TPR) repeat protein